MSATVSSRPLIWLTTILTLNMAAKSQIFLAQVAMTESLALPNMRTSTMAILSHIVWMDLVPQAWPQTLSATTTESPDVLHYSFSNRSESVRSKHNCRNNLPDLSEMHQSRYAYEVEIGDKK